MKLQKFFLFLVLAGSCFAQNNIVSGNAIVAGNAFYGAQALQGGAGGPLTYLARTDGCVGSVATPNVNPTSLAWVPTPTPTATVTTPMNPGANVWVYLSGNTGIALPWNLGWVKTATSSGSNFTFAWTPTLPNNPPSGIGTAGLCNLGAATGFFGSPLIYQEGVSDPVPFNRLDADTNALNCPSYVPPFHADCAVAGVPFVDPDFGSYSIFVTDQTTSVSVGNFSQGSDGGYDAFGLGYANDDLMTWTDSGGVKYLAHILEANFLAHACATSPCVVLSNVKGANCTPTPGVYSGAGICTQQQVVNSGASFSRNTLDTPNTLYEANLPVVTKTTFTTGGTTLSGGPANDSVTRATYVNFSTNSSGAVPCSVLPPNYQSTWNGTFKVGVNGAITIASGGGGPYTDFVPAGSTVLTPDVFILPIYINPGALTLNTQSYMFQASNGTTNGAGTEPTWATGCPTQGSTCTDGTVTWTNIGKVGSQGPGFDVVHFDPLRGCTRINTRLMKIYRGVNEGVNWPAAGSADPSGQVITDDAVTCFRMGGTNCGTGGTVNLTDKFTLHAGDQKYNSQYGGMDPTGGGSINKNYAGGGGNWPEISATPNGSCVKTTTYTSFKGWPPSGNMVWVTNTNYPNGTFAVSPANNAFYKLTTGAYVSALDTTDPSSDPTNWQYSSTYCYTYETDWNSGIVRPIQELGPNYGGSGHQAVGYNYDFRGGVYWTHYYNAPNCPNNTAPCAYVGAPNPGVKILTNSFPNDGHPSTRNLSSGDLQPIFDFTFAVPAWGGVGMPMVQGGGTGVGGYSGGCYNEICAFSTDGLQTVFRFGHEYDTDSNPGFGTQQVVGVISQDGKIAAWGSDFMNTRGDHGTGSATCVSPLRGQYQPGASQPVTYLDKMLPLGNNGPSNIYQAVGFYVGSFPTGSYSASGTGTEAPVTIPNWNTVCPNLGDYCTSDKLNNPATSQSQDGVVLWINLGPNSCRGDIALMDVTSAHQ